MMTPPAPNSSSPRPQPTSLDEWLAIALRDLAPSVQIRARAEVVVLYARALRSNKERGLSDSEAQAAALAELGDAQAGRERLGKRVDFMSTFDLRIIVIQAGVQISLSAILAMVFILFSHDRPLGTGLGLLLAFNGLVTYLAASAVWPLGKVATQRQLVLLVVLAWLSAGSFLLWGCSDPTSDKFVRVVELLIAFSLILGAVRITWKACRRPRQRAMRGGAKRTLFPLPAVSNLAGWLAIATADLAPSAQSRIRAEIETHYAEALQMKLANGLPEAQASAAALKDLGNAHIAAWRFSREYLTNLDTKLVALQVGTQLAMGTIWALSGVGVFLWRNAVGTSGGRLMLFAIFLVSFASRLIVPPSSKTITRRTILMLVTLTWLNVGVFVGLNVFSATGDHVMQLFGRFMTACFVLMAASASFSCFRVYKKLTSAGGNDLDPV